MQESLEEFIRKVKSLEIQGAKEIAIESLKFLRDSVKEKGFGKEFEQTVKKLEEARPSGVVLYNCLEILKKDRKVETINKLLRQLNDSTKKISIKGGHLIKNGYKIMTHCHSGEALAVIKHAWKEGKKITVYATETEPKHQGIKTAKELAEVGIPVTLITDDEVAFFMPKVDIVLIGSDSIRVDGIYNKMGTMFLALAAREFKKPFYIAANTLKLDRRKEIKIEERPPHEVYNVLKGVEIKNLAFEKVDWKFVTRVITEKGILTPGNVLRMLK